MERRADRTETDRFEQEESDFFQKVRDGYLAIAESEPQRMKVIDASQSIGAVQVDIATVLADFCPEL